MRSIALGECCEVVSGATPKTGRPEYWDGDIPWATPADLSELTGPFIEDTARKITQAGLKSCAATMLPAGSVLLSSRAPIGHVAINTRPMATNQGFKSLVPRPDVVDAKYLYHWLRARKGYLQSLGNGATFKEISKAVISRVDLPLPPIDEQRRLAAILDEADVLLTTRNQGFALLESATQALLHDLLASDEFSAVTLKRLVDEDDRINYGVVQPGDDVADGVPLIRVGDLRAGAVDRSRLKKISSSIEAAYSRSRVRGTEILLSCVGSIGVVALTSQADVGSNVARAVTRVPISDLHTRMYVAAVLASPTVQHYFVNELRTVSQPTLNGKQIGETLIPLPPHHLRKLFADRVMALAPVRESLQRSELRLAELRRSLETRAFAGSL